MKMIMCKDDRVSVKYTRDFTTVITYETGVTDWINLDDIYKGQLLRDKVVCKIDATKYLTKYFKIETIEKYRPVIMMLVKGQIEDAETLSEVIMDFISKDDVFADNIVTLFHSCPEDKNFGYYIIQCLADVFTNVEMNYRNFFRGKAPVVICVSDGYLYFSVSDVITPATLPMRIDCEVLSYAKNWKGNFEFVE